MDLLSSYEKFLVTVPNVITPFGAIMVMFLLAFIPIVFRANRVTKHKGDYNNVIPRQQYADLKGDVKDFCDRCTGAHLNGLEALTYFSLAVLMATVAKVDLQMMCHASSFFIFCRALYIPVYVYGTNALVATLRSLLWFNGLGVALYLMYSAKLAMYK